jgi:hypothetical protein
MSSDGSTYNATGDQITSSSSGAGGMDNASAWYRITDPGSVREYLFQRVSAHYSWIWQYSALDKFSGGTPDATTLPTATDSQGLARNSASAQTMLATSNFNAVCHISAQDTAVNGVYAWYCTTIVLDDIPNELFMCCEPIGSTSGDADPCVHYGSDDKVISTTVGSTAATSTDHFKCWMDMNGGGDEWQGVSALSFYSGSTSVAPYQANCNIANGQYPIFPIVFNRHTSTGSVSGFKGISTYLKWPPHAQMLYPIVLVTDNTNYLCLYRFLVAGWPSNVIPEL